jgi:O-antigen/teichoic acid export membrane protein
MQGHFLTNLILSLFLNLLIKPFSLLYIDAEVQNRVGAHEYGLYFSLLNLSVLLNILLDLGINNYTIRTMAQDPDLATKHVGRIIALRLLLFVFYTIITLIIGFSIGYNKVELVILSVLILNQLFIMFTAYARSYFSGLHYFKTDAVISVLDRFLLIVLCGSLLIYTSSGERFQIEWYVAIQTVCYLVTALVSLFVLSKIIRIDGFKLDKVFSISAIKESFPYALLILLMIIYTRSDSVILERLHTNGSYEAGIYAQGFRLLDALYMFGMVFVMLLFPMFSRILKQSPKDVFPLLQTSGNLLIGGCGVLVVSLCFNAESVLGWIYDSNIEESKTSFIWLMIGFFALSINFIFGTLLSANGNFKVLNLISGVAVIINVGLNFLLSPTYGAEAAGVVFFITQSFVSIIQLFMAKRIIPFDFNISLILKHVIILILLFILGLFFTDSFSLFISQALIGVLLLFLLKIIHPVEIKKSFLTKKETNSNN